MSSKQREVKPQHLTISDIEQMSIHELAELLGNIVLVLRRLPDVQMIDMERRIEGVDKEEV